MAKLKDVAEYLHVSVSTVSRVVNNKDRVDAETRRRVLAALAKFNYQPDENARRLKTNTSNVLGVIVPDISNPFYASVIKGIERVAARSGHSVILCNTDESMEREKAAIHLLLRQKVAGFISATILDDAHVSRCYAQAACPVVFFDNVPSVDVPMNTVTINNVRAATELVSYMIGRGHRRIFMISGPDGESSADDRLAGWRTAMQAAGLEPGDDWSGRGDFKEESGRLLMEGFLGRGERPTAVCVANNFMAYGAVKAIYAAGLSIPGEISIGAFDVADTTGLMKPMITTIIEPAEDIGAVSAEMCLAARAREERRITRRIVLEHRLMENETVRRLP